MQKKLISEIRKLINGKANINNKKVFKEFLVKRPYFHTKKIGVVQDSIEKSIIHDKEKIL